VNRPREDAASCREASPRSVRQPRRGLLPERDIRVAAVQIVRDTPPKALVKVSPVEQREAHLEVAQPSRLAGPGCTGDQPGIVGPADGQGPVDQTVRHHVLPCGRHHKDPGTAAHQVGLGPLEDDYVVPGPMQERRCRASGDRSPDNADSHARRPRTPWSATREVTAIRQCSGHIFSEEADETGPEGQPLTGHASPEALIANM
jgi:hypothetical protein